MDTRRTLTTVLFAAFAGTVINATDLMVKPGEYAIEKALQQAREERRLNNAKDICIKLTEGTYRLNQPVIIRPEDNGTRIVAEGNVTISGGIKIEGWRKEGKMYVADVPEFNGRPLEFRQMWINGKKAVRARDVDDFENMFRIRSLDKQKEVIYVPAAAVRKIVNARNAEMVLHEMWCVANLRIKNIKIMGDSAAVTFHNPESHIHFMHPWPSPMVTSNGRNSAFYLTNAKELLDTPGEWYLDTRAGKVYYMPRKGENMKTADVEVPAIETLVKVEGTPDNPVKDVTFEGVRFSHSTWLHPSISGHAPLQAGMYMIEAYKLRPKMIRPNGDHKLDNQGWVGRPSAAVSINGAENVNFSKCTFEHIASTAVDYHTYIKGGSVDRCTLKDVGGNGILAGSFGPEAHEAHLPYDPTDRRIICNGLSITNNLITNVTNEDWGCVGIGAGFVRNINICHNEISEISYTGVSMGWGWNRQVCSMANNRVCHNLIHHYAKHMYDTAGIYTLGSQPHSFIEENVVRDIYSPGYAHDPNHWFYLYTDEGSSYITVRNNWTPAEKYLKNANGPGNTWENNGPAVADSIKNNAGIK
ncbi:right-handed parallel beta-helix repeat-containing protein [Prevotella sp. PCHR]|uniref:Right-handed parallel beta-helix repeat-containing protein n=2 Tax=Xylanibacter caecicola TaxID=2736294 RepID=A0ABX2B129_9BACT|nr:right-handed parallel beta-helix repeat-containing protein [Xylanibacter caecicola]